MSSDDSRPRWTQKRAEHEQTAAFDLVMGTVTPSLKAVDNAPCNACGGSGRRRTARVELEPCRACGGTGKAQP